MWVQVGGSRISRTFYHLPFDRQKKFNSISSETRRSTELGNHPVCHHAPILPPKTDHVDITDRTFIDFCNHHDETSDSARLFDRCPLATAIFAGTAATNAGVAGYLPPAVGMSVYIGPRAKPKIREKTTDAMSCDTERRTTWNTLLSRYVPRWIRTVHFKKQVHHQRSSALNISSTVM